MILLWLYAFGGLVAVHAIGFLRKSRRILSAAVVFDAAALGFALLAFIDPERFEAWMQEDGWVEWATFYAYVVAAIVSLASLRSSRRAGAGPEPRWLLWIGLCGLAAFCAAVALEEISWGQRIFAFEPPEAFLADNFQQELNLHNMLKGKELAGVSLDSRYLVALIALGYGVVIPIAAEIARRTRRLWHPLMRALPPLHLSPWFAGVAVVELAYPVSHAGEACELVLGMLFVADALLRHADLSPTASRSMLPRQSALVAAVALALSLLTGPALDRLVYGSDDERSSRARAEVAMLERDLTAPGAVSASLLRRNVHKRMFTAMRSGYFSFGSESEFLDHQLSPADSKGPGARGDRLGYFLDPWNNPYWIHYRKNSRRAIVYSFGSNRRRDSDLDRGELGGDDIGLVFALAR